MDGRFRPAQEHRRLDDRQGQDHGAKMLAILLLLYYEPYGGLDIRLAGTWLIYIAAVLTLWSMFYYMRMAWPHLTSKDENR